MLRPRISPILLLNGSGSVKTKHFQRHKYLGDIINNIKIFNELGVDELAIYNFDIYRNSHGGLDLDFEFLKKISREASMPLTYGGGVDTAEKARYLVDIGFEKISICTQAFNEALIDEISDQVGMQSVVLNFDYRTGLLGKRTFFHTAGKNKLKQTLKFIIDYVNKIKPGEVCFQSITNEGLKVGFDYDLIIKCKEALKVPRRYSGGCGSVDDIKKASDLDSIASFSCSNLFTLHGKYDAVLLSYQKPYGWL